MLFATDRTDGQVYEKPIEEPGRMREFYKARGRGRQLECSLCKEPGATVDCSVSKCEEVFHFEVTAEQTMCRLQVIKITHPLVRFPELRYSAPSTVPSPNDTFFGKPSTRSFQRHPVEDLHSC